jgi:hypothetical protein
MFVLPNCSRKKIITGAITDGLFISFFSVNIREYLLPERGGGRCGVRDFADKFRGFFSPVAFRIYYWIPSNNAQ